MLLDLNEYCIDILKYVQCINEHNKHKSVTTMGLYV